MNATCWDHTGNSRVQVELRVGDRVHWKRNGQTGVLDAVVREFSISGERVRIQILETDEKRWVKPRFSAIFRRGQRLP